jgi:four helix bundle protein
MQTKPYHERKNEVLELAFDFALEVIKYTEQLEELRRYNMANQLFRCGTSIHANIREAQNAESNDDFIHKMKVAAKEANETEGWLLLCTHAESYPTPDLLNNQLPSVLRLLNKIISTSKRNSKKKPRNPKLPPDDSIS